MLYRLRLQPARQPIVREPVYSMFMVRCPECATCVAIQEYPTLGKWARRLSAILATLWIGLVIVLILASAGIVTGISQGSRLFASTPFAEEIAREFLSSEQGIEHVKNRYGGQNVPPAQLQPNAWTPVDQAWWESFPNKHEAFARAGGYPAALANTVPGGIGIVLTMAIAGVLLAGATPHLRGMRLLLPVVVWLAIAAWFFWLTVRASANAWNAWTTAQQIADEKIQTPLGAFWLGVASVTLAATLQAGRPILRWLAVALVPPRLRVGLSGLWICDGKDPPRFEDAVSDRPPRRSA